MTEEDINDDGSEQTDEWLEPVFGDEVSEHSIREGPQTEFPDEDDPDVMDDEGQSTVDDTDAQSTPEQQSLGPSIAEHEETILDRIDELRAMDVNEGGHDTSGEGGAANYLPVASTNDVSYIPVASSKMARLQTRLEEDIGKTVNGKRLGWWYPDSLMGQHPFVLINPLTMSASIQREKTAREHMEAIPGDIFVMGDSGGYQIANANGLEVTYDLDEHDGKNYIHPQRIAEWQMANADVGTILETPPYSYSKSEGKFTEHTWQDWYDQTFEEATEVTEKNTQIMADRVDEIGHDGYELMAIMHGIPRQDGRGPVDQAHQEWYDAIGGVRDWDSWALALGSADNPGLLTFGLGWFAENVEMDVFHALGQGNAWARILCKLFAQETDTFVTHDGTGFKMGSLYSQVHLPSTYLDVVRMTEREEENPNEIDHDTLAPNRMPCGCTVCRQVDQSLGTESLFADRPATERSVVMDLHNLNHLLRRFRFIDAYIEDYGTDILDHVKIHEGTGEIETKSPFWELLSEWFSESRVLEIYYAMDFLITSMEDGFDAATEDYTISTNFYDTNQDVSAGSASPSIARTRTRSVFEQW